MLAAFSWLLKRNHKKRSQLLVVCIIALCLIIATPIIAIFYLAIFPEENIWPHLIKTVLPGYLLDTSLLVLGVIICTFILGVTTAWIVTIYKFPGRSTLQLLLLLPMAMPTYIIAYCYLEIFSYSGIIQEYLREIFNWRHPSDYYFPEIRSVSGGIVVISSVLYPYVYLTARSGLLKISAHHIEVAKTLGYRDIQILLKVILPMIRPAIVVGISLAAIETLNDIGAVEALGINSLTSGIYTTWVVRGNLSGAAQISCVMLTLVIALIWIEQNGRKKQKYFTPPKSFKPITPKKLLGKKALLAYVICIVPISFGFILPLIILIKFAINNINDINITSYINYANNSFILALTSSVVTIIIGLLLAYTNRISDTLFTKSIIRFASFGYAIPGTILGIGVLVPFSGLDNIIDSFFRESFSISTGLILTGTIFSLVFAYSLRFLTISYGTINSGMQRISPNMDAAATILGHKPLSILRKIHIPILSPAIITASLMVFVDCMKELPTTLILRPFNFDTLATMTYSLASSDLIEESSIFAITIVVTGIIPVLILNKSIKKLYSPEPNS